MKESKISTVQNEKIEQQLNDMYFYHKKRTSQITQIEEQVQQRTKIYKKCLLSFKTHLQNEVKQLEDTYTLAESNNKLIQKTYELIYQNINEHSDQMLRNIRCTHQAKKKFWNEKIKEYVNSTELQFKKELYILKGDAEQRYFDAIQERRALKTIPFVKLTTQENRNSTLINYQKSNRQFQMNTHIGTFLKSEAPWKASNFYVAENKQNSMRQTLNYTQNNYYKQKSVKEQSQNGELLHKFMRR